MLVNFRLPLIRAMLDEGHEVIAIAPGIGAAGEERLLLRQMGVTCHDVPMARAGLKPLQDLSTLLALRALLKAEKPDLLLSYTVKPVVWGTIAARLAGVPRRAAMLTGLGFAFTGHDERRRPVRRIVSTLLNVALKSADTLIFHNRDDEAEFLERGIVGKGTRTVVVDGSGIDLDHFAPAPMPPAPPLRFLMISRLIGDKGAGDFLEAARRLRVAGTNCQIALVGDVDPNPDSLSEAEVSAKVEAAGIEWTRHLGDVRPAIASAHVLVLPSHREGLPRSVLEAMAMGRAIITTDAPGCRETVVPGVNGLLVPVADPEALAEAMQSLVDQPDRVTAMGEASLDMARKRFSTSRINQAMLAALSLTGSRS